MMGSHIRRSLLTWAPLLAIIAVSVMLRITLVLRGGQHYWPDEARFARPETLWWMLQQGELESAWLMLLTKVDHTGFILVGLPAVIIRSTVAAGWGLSSVGTIWVAALVLSMASVMAIGLVYAVARRAGASHTEALLATLLMACATSMLYYGRHFLPYDSAIALLLLALWVGLGRTTRLALSFICGLIVGMAFLTYNGYWLTGAIVLLIHVAYRQRVLVAMVTRALAAGTGLVTLPLLLTIASIQAGEKPYILALLSFAETSKQGVHSEGWSLPWEYLWHVEHTLLLVWGIALLITLGLTFTRSPLLEKRALLWLAAALGIYALLVVRSTVFEMFVPNGRSARQVVPFLCLMTAASLYALWSHRPRSRRARALAALALLLVVGQAGWNMTGPMTQQFPATFYYRNLETVSQFNRYTTIAGSERLWDDIDPGSPYVLVNVQHLFPVNDHLLPLCGTTLAYAEHPLSYWPYQYEGFTPSQRAILRSSDIAMRLVDIRPSSPALGPRTHPVGALRATPPPPALGPRRTQGETMPTALHQDQFDGCLPPYQALQHQNQE